jgi:hypothetical protein
MTKARFDEIKAHAGQEYAGGLRTETIAAFKDLIAEIERVGAPFEPEPKTEEELAKEKAAAEKAKAEREEHRHTSGARKK